MQTTHDKLMAELPFYSRHALKIMDKNGQRVPFIFNRVQTYSHGRLQKQIRERGFVRALFLKGRKQGISTYVGGRFYHRATTVRGREVFILSHDAKTTDVLFKMVRRFYDYSPPPLQPGVGTRNRNQLEFPSLDSCYTVGTAGNEDIGRGGTPLLFHGSEVGFWKQTDEIRSGILNAIPRSIGTEILLESTANGQSGMFFDMCMDAINGVGECELIFIPYFWQEEYAIPPPPDFVLSEEEIALKQAFPLSDGNLHWRRLKIADLGSIRSFRQEYPHHVMEAFQSSGVSLIEDDWVVQARKSSIEDTVSPLIIGVDPARVRDRTIISFRRGRHFVKYLKYTNMDEMHLAGIIGGLINNYSPAAVFIDVGYGHGTIDRLVELGYGSVVKGVNFSSTPIRSDVYHNKRAEMIMSVRDWFKEEGGARIPDDDEVHADFRCMPIEKRTSSGKIIFPEKSDIRKLNGGRSPDIYDSFALTFAYPVAIMHNRRIINAANHVTDYEGSPASKGRSPLKILSRFRGVKEK